MIETVDQADARSRELPTFQDREPPYLVTSLQQIAPTSTAQYAIRYQRVEGILLPAGFTFRASGLAQEVRVDFENVRLRSRKLTP